MANKEDNGNGNRQKEDVKSINHLQEFLKAMGPILRIEHCFGIFRFHVDKNGNLKKITKKRKLLGLCLIFFFVLLYFMFLWIDIEKADCSKTKELVNMVYQLPFLVIIVQYMLFVMLSIRDSEINTNISIFSALAKIDKKININTIEHSLTKKRAVIYLIGCTVCPFIFCFINTLTRDKLNFTTLVAFAIYYERVLETFVLCLLIGLLIGKLKVINDYLSEFVHCKHDGIKLFTMPKKETSKNKVNINYIGSVSYQNIKIRELARAYCLIGETCEAVNCVFNFQILMTLISTFMVIVLTIWSSIYYFRNAGDSSYALIRIIVWCAVEIFLIGTLCCFSEYILVKRNCTKFLVNEIIMNYDLPSTMRVQAKAFMELIDVWPLYISVFDMLRLDIKLMLKFISVATTYLIVIIQISHFV